MDNSSKLIEKIKQQNLKPLPRWRFRLKNTAAWLLFLFAVIFGALAFSVVLFAIQQIDFNLITHMSHSWFELLLGLLPFFWIVSLVVFLVAAIFSIKNSRKGYKFSAISLVGYSAALSILLGTLFFIGGGGKWLENTFATNVSLYESVQERKIRIWMQPEEGYLSGTITEVEVDSLKLTDFNKKTWTITFEDADIVPAVRIETGEQIKIIGEMASQDNFKAEKIRPWGGGDRFRENNQNK